MMICFMNLAVFLSSQAFKYMENREIATHRGQEMRTLI